MECPQCRAPGPDDAASCGLCHHVFRPKQPAPPASLMVAPAECRIKGVVYSGTLFLEPEGFYFFVEKQERQLKLSTRLAGFVLGQAAGLIGGVAVNAALERLLAQDTWQPPLALIHRDEAPLIYEPRITPASRLIFCPRYFMIERERIASISIPEDDVLLLTLPGLTLECHGEFEEAAVSGKLRLWAFPMGEASGAAGARGAWAFLLVFLGLAGVLLDMAEVKVLLSKLASLSWVKLAIFDGAHYRPGFVIFGSLLFLVVALSFYFGLGGKPSDD